MDRPLDRSSELRWLWQRARKLRGLYAAQLSMVLLASLAAVADPLVLKWLLDDVLLWRNADMLVVAAGLFLVLKVANLLFLSGGFLVEAWTSQRLMLNLRLELVRHLQALSPEYYLHTPAGDLMHRVEQDVNQIRELGGQTVASVVRIVVMSLLAFAILFTLDWLLASLVLVLVPVAVVARSLGVPRLRRLADRSQATSARRVSFLQEHLGQIPQVQLLDRTTGERRRFLGLAREAIDAALARRSAELTLTYGIHVAAVLANTLVLGVGGARVLQGELTVGGLVAFHGYLALVFGPTQSLANLTTVFQRVGASIRRVREVLETEPTVVDPPRPVRLPGKGPLRVSLQEVRFAYPDGTPVLEGLDLEVAPGERVALVGASGGGKSTVARLLTRMYDPRGGRLALDGVDLRNLSLRALRNQVALVPQTPVLFDASVRENLLCAALGADDERLARAVELAELKGALDALPRGWDEPVGSLGGRLSGGQRQRLAIARALLRRPRLLILDEATSALDAMTEYRLLRGLGGFVAGRVTTLLIAHRMSAIRWAERVVLLDGGRVAADGSHETLYATCPAYREICDRQSRNDDETLQPEPTGWPEAAAAGAG